MDIFVLPSYREGFPRSVLEAMSSALPVVATNIRGCREAVVDGETGWLVPPRNGAALAEAVGHLVRDPKLAARFGSAGRERAVRLYDQRLVQRRFVDFIEDAFLPERRATAHVLLSILKRTLDLAGATAGVVFLFPIMILAWAAIRVGMGGPALFRQQRVGLGGREFTLFKFRTMSEECDSAGRLLPDEQRLNPLGSCLRRTSVDELPQLINVLRGELSLVGPRPLLPVYLERYSEVQRRRHEVKPGLTGWAQIHGRNAITWSRRFELDIWYVDHWGFWLDMKIVCRTIGQMLWWKGISGERHATMPEFLGTEKK
jgi:sugar transferase EpsL